MMVSSERRSRDLSEYTLFKNKKKFYKNQFLGEICWFFCSFFKLLTKFSDFINSDDCIKKSHQNLTDFQRIMSEKQKHPFSLIVAR